MEKQFEYQLEDISKAAHWFIKQMAGNKIFAFEGQMGAGKTTLIKEICDQMGIKDKVSSPTFSLVNEYVLPNGKGIFHLDLYRIKSEEEAYDAGIEDLIYSGSICFVEWPEKVAYLFTSHFVRVQIELAGHNQRIIKLEEVQ